MSALVHRFARPRDLRPWIELVWYSRGRLDRLGERVLPSATTDIVANLGAPMRHRAAKSAGPIRGTTVTGLLTRPLDLEHPRVHEAVGARLTPHGLRAVLGVPAAAVRDVVVDVTDISSSRVDELTEACLRGVGSRARLAGAVGWFRRRIGFHRATEDSLVRWATRRLDETRGRLPVSRLQKESGWSATRFTERFRNELGVTPKRYARLVRFRAALDRLGSDRSLSRVAHDLGFADQSHMNREFRLLGDTTPTECSPRGTTRG